MAFGHPYKRPFDRTLIDCLWLRSDGSGRACFLQNPDGPGNAFFLIVAIPSCRGYADGECLYDFAVGRSWHRLLPYPPAPDWPRASRRFRGRWQRFPAGLIDPKIKKPIRLQLLPEGAAGAWRRSQPLTGPVIERVSPLDQHRLTAAGRLGDIPSPAESRGI
jgi:hypothetical protein